MAKDQTETGAATGTEKPDALTAQFQALNDRLTALETRPANGMDKEQLDALLSDHPVIADFRKFLAKWGDRN